jgi:adenylate kinase family enzyme
MSYYLIIRGPLGCGKTTIAKKLAKTLPAKYFDIDKILLDNNLINDQEQGYISQRSLIKVNEILAVVAEKFIKKGKPIIFDGNFYWQAVLQDLIRRLNFPHYVFTLKVPVEVCLERDKKRKSPLGQDAVEVVYKKTNEFDYGINIDATKSEEEIIKEIANYIK